MLILDSDQVDYCKVVKQTSSATQVMAGVKYQGRLFFLAGQYPPHFQEDAIRAARKQYDEDGSFLILVIPNEQRITIWHEDKALAIYNATLAEPLEVSQIPLEPLVQKMRGRQGVPLRTRFYKLAFYSRCFTGAEAVSWWTEQLSLSRESAHHLGQRLLDERWMRQVNYEPWFRGDASLYRFYCDEV